MVSQQEKLAILLKKVALISFVVLALLLICLVLIEAKTKESLTAPTTTSSDGLLLSPFQDEDFTYDENGYMTCLKGESWLGIDVSYHQGDIRWQEVADHGMKFAMIRIGHRTVRQGIIYADDCWEKNYSGAREAGLEVGVYFYSQAVSVEEARQEAKFVLEALDGRLLEFPVVFDWEIYDDYGRTADVDKQTLTACAIAFCEMIADAGYKPMVYFNKDLASQRWDLELMQRMGYGLWYARYADKPQWPYRIDIWQYTESGTVAGIDEPVDIDLYFRYE